MKELSIEQKAKAYDEAIEKAKSKLHYADKPCFVDIKEIFPELKESEDENIRKELIHIVKTHSEFCGNEWKIGEFTEAQVIAYLEKQGENNKWKPSKDEMDALYGLAYITNKMDDKKDEAITKLYQDLKREFFNGVSYENMFPSSPVNAPIKLKKQGEQKPVIVCFRVGDIIRNKETNILYCVHHITEEGFLSLSDVDKKAFKGYLDESSFKNYELVEQKPAWSEEDKRMFEIVLWHLRNSVNNGDTDHSADHLEIWFKSLKDRIIPQPK